MKQTIGLLQIIKSSLAMKCPKCGKGSVFKGFLTLVDKCSSCHLKFKEHDSGDGPAVFLIFVLGFTIVPIALYCYMKFDWPEWIHFTLWPMAILGATIGMLRPVKSLTMALHYHYITKDREHASHDEE